MKPLIWLICTLTVYILFPMKWLVVTNSYYLSRNLGRSSRGALQTTVSPMRSLRQSGSNEKHQTLFILPSGRTSSEKVLSFVQSWAQSEAEGGPL